MTDASSATGPAPDAGAQAAAAKLKGVRAGGGSAARSCLAGFFGAGASFVSSSFAA